MAFRSWEFGVQAHNLEPSSYYLIHSITKHLERIVKLKMLLRMYMIVDMKVCICIRRQVKIFLSHKWNNTAFPGKFLFFLTFVHQYNASERRESLDDVAESR